MNLLLFLLGLAALVGGASLLVRGASKLALSAGISPLVVGLTIVAFGTSAPEVAVSVGAVFDGKTDLAIGNVVGSNIFNVLFILGVSALITPLVVNVQLIRQEVPIMVGASLLLLVLGLDGRLSLWDAAFLFALLIAYTVSWSGSRGGKPAWRRLSTPRTSGRREPAPGMTPYRCRSRSSSADSSRWSTARTGW